MENKDLNRLKMVFTQMEYVSDKMYAQEQEQ